jgi:hypothetical protein
MKAIKRLLVSSAPILGFSAIVLLFNACDNTVTMEARIMFLHHAVGGVIWLGGVQDWFIQYNTTNGTAYEMTENAFPSGVLYPWNNGPYDYWNIWINDGGGGEPTLETLTADYDVIVWKHDFMVGDMVADSGPDISSDTKSLENYKLQYNALKTKMHAFPSTRFIVWTGAARLETETTHQQADRARSFYLWVKDTWDVPGDNIYLWDFYALETEGGSFLTPGNSDGTSFPNSTFAGTVAPYLGQRIVDVIQGYGDLKSITGN